MTTTTSTANSPLRPDVTGGVLDLDVWPRFGTRRRAERQTLGPAVGMVAALLGMPFMPWQQYVADVILEIDPETGQLAYTEWGLTVPRQSGKSTFILAKSTHRCTAGSFFGRRQRCVYTAQTRQKARQKWEEDYLPPLDASKRFRNRHTPYRGTGYEHTRFANGSMFALEANTEKAGHGGTLDEAYIDEAFAQVDNRLEQAFRPAMITRANRQLGWISTAGWSDASPYLLRKVEAGRLAVAADTGRGLAYFEWSAPDDADPSDPDVWVACMPALGHTITIEAIAEEYATAVREGKLDDFRRAYLNQWRPKPREVDRPVIAPTLWEGCEDPESEIASRIRFALDVYRPPADDEALPWSAIAVAGLREDDVPHVEVTSRGGVIDHRPGVDWVVERLGELREAFPGMVLVIAAGGGAESLIPEIEDLGIVVETISPRDVAAACGFLFDSATTGRLRHLGQAQLDEALAVARQRTVGDGAWAWGRRKSTEDITPVYAVTLALWAISAVDDADVSVIHFDDLDLCDSCGVHPHEDPDGDHDYLCDECRED
jgi:hypothetical protein